VTISAHPGRLLWHHQAHTDWGESRLYLWFISFRRSYDPDEVLSALHDFALDRGITAFTSYELLGPYDILLRLYVPSGDEEELLKATERLLKDYDLKMVAPFSAVEVARHWAWAKGEDGTGQPRSPTKTTIRKRRPGREIAIINEMGRLAELPLTVELTPANADLLNTYVADRLVTFASRNQGIRFVTIVTHPDDIDNDALNTLTRQLSRALDSASPLVSEGSLYRGRSDHRMAFVLMYRVGFTDFHRIRREFLQDVREIVGAARASTMTSVIVSDDVKCFADALPEDEPSDAMREVLDLLGDDEARDFEVKGSALARLDPWLYKDQPLESDHGFFRDTILKTIAGFLNTRGGVLVLGALETNKLRPKGAAKLADPPTLGPHTCVGLLDPVFAEKGWDAYLRQISSLISGGIDPSPGGLVEIDREQYEGREMMVIRIEEPADDEEYYVPESDKSSIFYARVENRTVPLRGSEIKRHMKHVVQRRNHSRARNPK
jgi:hypothetical protein